MSDTKLSPERVDDIRQVFKLYDTENKGRISVADLGKAMKQLGLNPTETELQDLLHEADTDNNGLIDFSEFLALMQKSTDVDSELRAAFQAFDKDGNGYIDFQELQAAMVYLGESMSDAELKQLFKQADTDGNGTISFAEFRAMMSNV